MSNREACSLILRPKDVPDPATDVPAASPTDEQVAIFGAGCFWCVEAVFKAIDGVHEVVSGYAGGSAETADYQSVCSGRTGHAEVIEIRFDPNRTSFGHLLKVFFTVAHDPTQLDRQGNDVGTQYRSAIFPTSDAQREVAEAYMEQLERAGVFDAPIVTRIEPFEEFYPAEAYHQDYAARNPNQPYVAYTTPPKLEKLRENFADRLRDR